MTEKDQNKKLVRMRQLIDELNEASKAYYQTGSEIMPNFRYDALYDELEALEKETGVVMSFSPTQKVGYEVASGLEKQRHESPMLSLSKTKDRQELASWLGDHEGLLSWKLDGLTIVLSYDDGVLKQAVTRGNGEVGEVITANAKCFENLPAKIPFKGSLVVRGEAVISYADFEKINDLIEDEESRYRNPRNLCSGSVRQLDPAVTKQRHVRLIAFALVSAAENGEAVDFKNSNENKYLFLQKQGFETVEYKRVSSGNVMDAVEDFAERIRDNPLPSDGLVLLYDDIAYGDSLGRTAKAPRNAIAFKWQDETAVTHLQKIEWSPSRTGLINPVAVFDPVELEGTTVTRASVHNVSIVKALQLGIGDEIIVYKANMIIPQIAENLTRSGKLDIPGVCPACGQKAVIHKAGMQMTDETEEENVAGSDTETLVCENPGCSAKMIKSFSQFVSRDALNIEGLSEQTLEKFIARGFIKEFADILLLKEHGDEIGKMEGFGEKSCKNLLESIERSCHTTLSRFLFALGIPGVGVAGAKLISRHFDGDYEKVKNADTDELSAIDGVGPVMARDIRAFFEDENKRSAADHVCVLLSMEQEQRLDTSSPISGKVFVVTGSVEHFSARSELKAYIEARGGKVTGSVTSKTDYLINNDVNSNSSKNKKAKELGVTIISEEDFLKMTE